MGRQVAVIASPVDEQSFLSWLRTTAPIQLFSGVASTKSGLRTETFAPFCDSSTQYFIWNEEYAWRPKILRGDPARNNGQPWCRIDLPDHGPVLEFDRTDMQAFLRKGCEQGLHVPGRLYWGQYNRQKGFMKWYESIVRWVRKNGVNVSPCSSWAWYCLPDAYRLWQEHKSVHA